VLLTGWVALIKNAGYYLPNQSVFSHSIVFEFSLSWGSDGELLRLSTMWKI